MTDLASLVLEIDSTQVKTGTAALDGLTAAGTRAQAASVGFGAGARGAGVEAAAMASAAQLSARAAMDQAAGFRVATDAARVNTLAMRESLVVAREIARGNFTRLPGSLSLLAQGIGSQGGAGSFASAMAQQLGLIKQVQNAELAEAAAAAASAAAGVEGAVRKAGANIMAADTEVALAEAQLRVAEGAEAEAAAQARLTAANEAVAAAASEAAIAENALAVAQGRAAETGAASAAATRTMIGGSGIGLIGIATVAAIAYGAIKQFQDQVRDSGDLDTYADKLNLTDAEIKKLGGSVTYLGHNIKEVHGLTVSFGDVMYGVWHEIAKEISDNAPWHNMGVNAHSAFDGILNAWNNVSAGITAGLRVLENGFLNLAAVWHGGVGTRDTSIASNFAKAKAENDAAFAGIEADAIAHRKKTMQDLALGNNPAKGPRDKKESDHGLREALDKLDAEIKGQYALAAAYDVSAAAAQRATAQQKAAEDAISHKGGEDLFYAKELQKAVAEDVARQAKSNAGLDLENSIRARLNGEVVAGTTSLASYNDKLKLQVTLNALNADLENADTAHKQAIRDLIKQTIDLDTEQLQLKSQLAALTDEAANDNEIDRIRLENSLMGASNKERAIALAQLEAIQKLQQLDPNGLLTTGERNDYVQSAVNKAVAGVQSPFQQWAKDIPTTAAAITEALQTIEFKGFDGLASAITDVVTGTKSLGAAFKEVAASIIHDIVEMTIKMLIFRAISSIFGNVGGGGNPAASVGLLSANGNVFSGGNVVPFASGGIFDSPTMFPMAGGRTGLMGEAGPEAVMPLTRDGQGRLGVRAANNNAPQEIIVHISTDQNFHAEVAQVAGQVVVRAAPTIIKAASSNVMRTVQRPRLGSG